MFGYVKIRKADLRVKEYEFYKAVYCGLCHHQKKLSRRLRYTLSYDMVMLALARMGVAGERACFSKKRCPVHPVKGCLTVDASESLAYTAAASAILLYEKLRDDIHDERALKRLLSKFFLKSTKKALRHADLPALHGQVTTYLDALSTCESKKSPSVYDGAEIFGKLLGEVFAYDPNESLTKAQTVALFELGYRTGRFIYILDAYADREKDAKENRYNPFNQNGDVFDTDGKKNALVTALDMEMVQAAIALDLLAISDRGIHAILENLVKLGLGDVARAIILKNQTHKTLQAESEMPR